MAVETFRILNDMSTPVFIWLGPETVLFKILDIKMFAGAAKIVSEYDQEIPQSQTADNPVAPRGRAAQTSRDTRKTN